MQIGQAQKLIEDHRTFVQANLVTWRSKKQVVSRSSAEAKLRALAQCICEGIWLKSILLELRLTTEEPMEAHCDNQATISIAKDHIHRDRIKHEDIDRHVIKEKIENKNKKLTVVL